MSLFPAIPHLTSFLFSLCTHVLTGRPGSYVPVVANFFWKKKRQSFWGLRRGIYICCYTYGRCTLNKGNIKWKTRVQQLNWSNCSTLVNDSLRRARSKTQFCQIYVTQKTGWCKYKHKFTCYVRNEQYTNNQTPQWKSGYLKKKEGKVKTILLWLFDLIHYYQCSRTKNKRGFWWLILHSDPDTPLL